MVATFTDANMTQPHYYYTAQLTWSNGSGGPAYITGWGGVYTVMTYPPSLYAGSYTATVTIQDPAGQSVTATSAVTVGNFAVNAPASLSVYGFSYPDQSATSGSFTATVDWGDGADASHPDLTAAQVVEGSGVFGVVGNHTYLAAASYTAQVNVTGPSGATIQASSVVTVAETLFGAGQDVSTVEAQAGHPGTFLLDAVHAQRGRRRSPPRATRLSTLSSPTKRASGLSWGTDRVRPLASVPPYSNN